MSAHRRLWQILKWPIDRIYCANRALQCVICIYLKLPALGRTISPWIAPNNPSWRSFNLGPLSRPFPIRKNTTFVPSEIGINGALSRLSWIGGY